MIPTEILLFFSTVVVCIVCSIFIVPIVGVSIWLSIVYSQ